MPPGDGRGEALYFLVKLLTEVICSISARAAAGTMSFAKAGSYRYALALGDFRVPASPAYP
jgi:hypothetical protein